MAAEQTTEEPEVPAEDNQESAKQIPVKNESRWRRFKNWYKTDKKKSIPLTVLALVILLVVVPWSRYHAVGLVLKKDFKLQVLDATARVPVSGAEVNLGAARAITDANGTATLHNVRVGQHNFQINKKYYQDQSAKLLVPILGQKHLPQVLFVATGRQVRIVVSDLINQQKLSGVEVKAADVQAKTDKTGAALIALPVATKSQKVHLSLKNYNDATATVQVSDSSIKQNNLKLTPAGKIYFLSKLTGRLDVMKANLDGSQPELVVAGTGNEQEATTVLSQSPDGQYVALLAKRNAADPAAQLYVLAAEDDKLLQADGGNATFNLAGWVGDSLVYTSQRQDLRAWQTGLNKLKAYDAGSGKITLLDQSAGSDQSSNVNEVYNNVVLSGGQVIYSKYWGGDTSNMSGKQNTVQIIDADGQNHQTVASYDAATSSQQIYRHGPASFYILLNAGTASQSYYDYTIGSQPKALNTPPDQLSSTVKYFFSPSGKSVFWADIRDGKNALIVSDGSGSNQKTITTLSDFAPYGWYGDKYLLVTQNAVQLYIMGVKGGTPIKITDFQPSGS